MASDRSGYCPFCVAVLAFIAKELASEAVVRIATAIDPRLGVAVEVAQTVSSPSKAGREVVERGARALAKDVASEGVEEAVEAGATRAAKTAASGACFVEGTGVRTPGGLLSIDRVQARDRVVAGSTTQGDGRTTQRPAEAPSPPRRPWTADGCGRLARAAKMLALSSWVLTACEDVEPPEAHQAAQVYDVRTGSWSEQQAGAVEVGGELLHDGHLFRVEPAGPVDLGAVQPWALADADAVATDIEVATPPEATSWVLVLADEDHHAGHARLEDVAPGDRFAFQGRVYEALGEVKVNGVRETGEVIGRVADTFVRVAEVVIDVGVAYADGAVDTLTGTPNHPFWVPSVQDYIELKDLEVGTVLRTYGGSEATVLGLAFRKGDVEVYDIEVEGLHNFFVRGPGSDAPGVLVHNSTPKRVEVSRSSYPESAAHIDDAQAAGQPSVLTVDRGGATANRRESLRGTETTPGMDRDEYPPAMFEEGGAGASVRPVSPSDNRGAGACIGAQCRDVPDGGQVEIVTTD